MTRLALTLLAALAVACGGSASGERILHIKGQDISEEDYKTHIRVSMAENPVAFGLVCNSIRDLTNQEAVDFFSALFETGTDDGEQDIFRGGTPVPGQEADLEDAGRAIAIVQAECERVFPDSAVEPGPQKVRVIASINDG